MREEQKTQNEEIASVPYIVYESAQNRMERTNKRLLTALIIAIILAFISNLVWLYAWMQYDYSGAETETTTETIYQQDGEGYNNINTGKQGDLTNGAKYNDSENYKNPNPNEDEKADE